MESLTNDENTDESRLEALQRELDETKRQLKIEQDRLLRAQRAGHMGFWDWDLLTDRIEWSDEIYAIFGLAPDRSQATYDAFLETVHPGDREYVRENVQRALELDLEYSIDHRVLRPSGEIRYVHEFGEITRAADGTPTRMIGMSVDLTERHIAENAVREAEEQFRGLWQASADALLICTHEGRIARANTEAEHVFGYESEELTGRPIGILVPARFTHHGELMDTFFAAPHPRRMGEFRSVSGIKKDGTEIPVEVSLSPMGDADEPVVLVGVRNISHRLMLERQLHQSQKMEAVGRLAGGLAHDLNNVLTVISGFTEMALDVMEPEHSAREDLEEVLNSSVRASELISKLMSFSRKKVLVSDVVDLDSIVENVASMIRRLVSEEISFETRLAKGQHPVEVDTGQIEQLLLNLTVNASDAMPGGGRLLIETSCVELAENAPEFGTTLKPGPHVLLSVSDTGCGMDDDTRRNAFEPFFTTKGPGKGTGLGLAMVYGIVRQSRGHIDLISEVGKGTQFNIYFPASKKPTAQPAPKTEAVDELRGTETVLVVEDDPAVRGLASRTLVDAGYTVLTAGSPSEALERYRHHPPHVDLLLTDVIMPGMNGRDLARAFETLRPNLRVLYMSGYLGDAYDEIDTPGARPNFIQKPFKRNRLLEKIREALGPKRAGLARDSTTPEEMASDAE